eukprot:TRINITY_DN60124_c0_g1_i1.p1 TRINITY_DN60124_c0_g1~~TRINITY_DN60124_c0_g1_i1.p1  ORF type:complete len:336 (-),score=82.17 TRINITY_DN60124_c0_g1_i1:45-1052(-)
MLEGDRPIVGECGSCGEPAELKCSGCKMVTYCKVECQKSAWKDHRQNCRCFEIREVKNKGKGIFALREISAGEIVMKEKPLVILTTPHTPKTLAKYVAELRGKVKSLDEDRQEDFYSLGISRPELCTKDRGDLRMMGIFQTNSIPIREYDKLKGKDLGAAVYKYASRINHSCKPNVVWSFTQAKKVKEVRATKPILAGEEVTACYIDPLNMAEDRQKLLSSKYNFTCSCEICSLPTEKLKENDRLRREILGLNNNMEDVYDQNPQKALKYAKMKLERMEKIRDEMIEIFPQTYMDCYELCLAQKENEIAQIFSLRGKEVAKLIRGENSLWSRIQI